MTRGLHICKPGNTPNVGQVKTFVLLPMGDPAQGNEWTKIKSEKPDKGGQHYMIMSVAKTDYTDQYGNVSFNLELEPANPPPAQPSSYQSGQMANATAPVASSTTTSGVSPQPRAFDTVDAFITRSANLYNLCLEKADTVIRDRMRARNIDLHEHPAWFQAIVTTLFINAKDNGYISHMPDKEQKPPTAKLEPY